MGMKEGRKLCSAGRRDIKVTARRHGNEQRTKRPKGEAWEVKLLDFLYVARG
jgi:hypothetical protein